jgi:hypothetical protein
MRPNSDNLQPRQDELHRPPRSLDLDPPQGKNTLIDDYLGHTPLQMMLIASTGCLPQRELPIRCHR